LKVKAINTRNLLVIVTIIIIVTGVGWYLIQYYTSPRTQETIKIGLLVPLSPPGDYSAGQFMVRGAQLAVEMLNEKGGLLGKRVELLVEDDGGTPEKGVAGARKLILQDRVIAIVGQFHSSVALAVQDVCEQYGVPLIVLQASSARITEKHLNTTFRIHVIDPDRAALWVSYIKQMGYKKVAMIMELTDYGIGLANWTQKLIKDWGLNVDLRVWFFDRTATDFTPQLLEIKAWDPDVIINGGVGVPVYLITKQAYDLGILPKTPMIISYDAPARSEEYWRNVGEAGVGVLFVIYYHPLMNITKLGKEFQDRYYQKYGEYPIYTAFNAFGGVMILAQAIEKAGSTDPKAIINALLRYEFTSWNGIVKFTRGEGPYWQQWSPPIMLAKYTKFGQKYNESVIVFTLGG